MCTIRPTAPCCRTSVRVLTRTMQRASTAMGDAPGQVRNRLRSVYAPRADHQLRGSIAEDTAGHDPELSAADGHDARGLAQCGHDDPPCGPARAHREPTGATDPASRADAIAADAATRPAGDCPDARATPSVGIPMWPTRCCSIFEPHTETIRKGKIATPNQSLGSWSLSRKRSIRSLRAMRCMPRGRQIAPCGRLRLDRHCTIFGRAPGSGRRRSRIQFGCQ